jgi:hypothetical protein
MINLKTIVNLLGLGLLAGCVVAPGYTGPDQPKISPFKMAERLQYRGFSMPRPEFGWFVSSSEQTQTHAIVRRRFFGSTHSACVDVDILSLPHAAGSYSDFADLCRQDRISDTNRFTIIAYRQTLTKIQGEWAVEYDLTMRENGGTRNHKDALTVSESGCIVRHPSFPNTVVRMKYCERGEPSDFNADLAVSAKKLIETVRIDATSVKLSAK